MSEPLKNKMLDDGTILASDVFSAVQWLKKEICGCETWPTDNKCVNCRNIDLAFEDVIKKDVVFFKNTPVKKLRSTKND